jgi:hypothetical protein
VLRHDHRPGPLANGSISSTAGYSLAQQRPAASGGFGDNVKVGMQSGTDHSAGVKLRYTARRVEDAPEHAEVLRAPRCSRRSDRSYMLDTYNRAIDTGGHDAPTIVSLQSAYWNLAGEGSGTVHDPADQRRRHAGGRELDPTGAIDPVAKAPMVVPPRSAGGSGRSTARDRALTRPQLGQLRMPGWQPGLARRLCCGNPPAAVS